MIKIFVLAALILTSTLTLAREDKAPKYNSLGKTHTVRTYTKKNGTIVQQHRAGNPRSGVHCKDNICY